MTTLNDIEFLRGKRDYLDRKRCRRAKRLLRLYIDGRTPDWKATETYKVLCDCVRDAESDIEREIEAQAMAASV